MVSKTDDSSLGLGAHEPLIPRHRPSRAKETEHTTTVSAGRYRGYSTQQGLAVILLLCTACVTLALETASQLQSGDQVLAKDEQSNALQLFATPTYRVLDDLAASSQPQATGGSVGAATQTPSPAPIPLGPVVPTPTTQEDKATLTVAPAPTEAPTEPSATESTPKDQEVASPETPTSTESVEPTAAADTTTPAQESGGESRTPLVPGPTLSNDSSATTTPTPKPTASPRLRNSATYTRFPRPGGRQSAQGAPTPAPPVEQPPAQRMRTRHDDFDRTVSRDRGLIISLHNGIVALGLSLIKDLRCMGNNELIQVYHCFPNELTAESRDLLLLNETRLEIIDVCTHYINSKAMTTAMATKFRNWWTKPLALYHTDLREVVLLDADAIPLRDPAVLRSLPGYQRTGTTFFFDRVIPSSFYFNADARGARGVQMLQHMIQAFDYTSLNLTGAAPSDHLINSLALARKTCHEMDSSMLAVDKSRAGKAMDVLWHILTSMRFQYDFSWGDKEAFWLAYELAHVNYFFSPWGVSVVSSSTNRDMEEHPNTLCGSLAHFLPVQDDTPELFYVNGKALLDAFPQGVDEIRRANKNLLFNVRPTHVTPRQPRKEKVATNLRRYNNECLVDLGSTPVPVDFQRKLLRRRTFFLGIQAGFLAPLSHCEMF